MTNVRSKSGAPVESDFSSPRGTPIVVDDTAGSVSLSIMDSNGEIQRVSPESTSAVSYFTPEQLADALTGSPTLDMTAALQSAITNASNRRVDFGDNYTFKVTAPLVLQSNTTYCGHSKIIGVGVTGAILDGSDKSGVVIRDLEIDGNADAGTSADADHGIQLANGSGNQIIGCYIHDTYQAGIRCEDESSLKVLSNRLVECGRSGPTDNHGMMFYSTTAGGITNDVLISGNTVDTAFRKGIGTAAAGGGIVRKVTIVGNTVYGCGLGGIYVSSATQEDITVVGNTCVDNYVGIEFDNVTGGCVVGNACSGSTIQGIASTSCVDTLIDNNTLTGNGVDGVLITTPTDVSYGSVEGKNRGVNVAIPLNNWDIGGGLTIREQPITLSSSVSNDNIVLPADAGTLYVVGPTSSYQVTGFAGGHNGRKITLWNYTSYSMTVRYASTSSAANQILIGGSADLFITSYGCVEFQYSSAASKWFVVGSQP